MQIRQANLSDLPRLVHLRQERYTLMKQSDLRVQPASLSIEQALNHPDCTLLVAVFDAQVIGYLLGWMRTCPYGLLPAQTRLIEEIALDAHKYYGGSGRALLDAFRAQSQADEIFALVSRSYAVEQAFWRSLGAQSTNQLQIEMPVTSLCMILQ